jgi:hypothetical protein
MGGAHLLGRGSEAQVGDAIVRWSAYRRRVNVRGPRLRRRDHPPPS